MVHIYSIQTLVVTHLVTIILYAYVTFFIQHKLLKQIHNAQQANITPQKFFVFQRKESWYIYYRSNAQYWIYAYDTQPMNLSRILYARTYVRRYDPCTVDLLYDRT